MVLPALASAVDPSEQRVSFDMRDMDAMRRLARSSPEEGLKQVSKQFEALFMGMLLKSMRDANPSSGFTEGPQAKIYQSLLDQQLSQKLAGRGIGLADAMFAQLRRTIADPAAPGEGSMPAPAGAAVVSSAATGSRPPAAATDMPRPIEKVSTANPPLSRAIRAPRAEGVDLAPAQLSPSSILDGLQSKAEGFIGRIGQAARVASESTGVPQALILAQAALESGWGRREIVGRDGAPSFNLFGIKADRSWRGPVAEAATTEFIDGAMRRVTGKFRAYGSYEEAFADYAKFLTRNPRYAGVLSAEGPQQAAQALQRAGYATDPEYASKLIRLMKRFL